MWTAELTEAAKYWNIKVNLVPSRTDSKGRIVVVHAWNGASEASRRRAGEATSRRDAKCRSDVD